VIACVGLLTQTEPTLGEDMPKALKDLAEDIDRAGTAFPVFVWFFLFWAIVDGRVGILVDYPKVANPEQIDASTEKRLGLRPYWTLVQSPDIFLPLYEIINGIKTLTLLILRETVQRRVGRYGVGEVTRFRIYAREQAEPTPAVPNPPIAITSEIWESPPNDPNSIRPLQAPTELRNVTKIPFAYFVAGTEILRGEPTPPLLSLAELVIEHHQLKTDIRHLIALACVPTLKRKGYQVRYDLDGKEIRDPVILGPRAVIDVPKDGDVEWLTPEVDVLDPAMKQLQQNEAAQGAMGLQFLTPDTRAAETAEAKRLDATAENATLASIGRRAADPLEEAWGFTAEFSSRPGAPVKAGSVTIHTDFEETVMDPQTMQAFGALARDGKLSLETLLGALIKGKRLPEGFDINAEIRRIMTENVPPTVDPSTDPTAPAQGEDITSPQPADRKPADPNPQG
jgi:hypothetical protein